MNMHLDVIGIVSRWIHVSTACVLVGSVFFFHLVLPPAIRAVDNSTREAIYIRLRRGFKMTVHISLALFLLTGSYNAVKNWKMYTMQPGLMHGLFGMHLLLGLGAITVLMFMLAGRELRPPRLGGLRWILVALLLGVGMASGLKSVREWTTASNTSSIQHPAAPLAR